MSPRVKDVLPETSVAGINADDKILISGATGGDRVVSAQDLASGGGGGSGNYFGTVAVSGQDPIVAEADPDTLNIAAGTGISLTTNAGTDTLTVAISDAELLALAGLTSAADKGLHFTGPGAAALHDLTAFARTILAAADAAAVRTLLGLGTMATQAASNVTITGGSIAGITDLAVADGGTGASTAAGARTNLGYDKFAMSMATFTPEAKTYRFRGMAFAGRVDNLVGKLSAGSMTVAISINGTAVTDLSAVTIGTSESTTPAGGSNTWAIGDDVEVTLSALSAAANAELTLNCTRL